jgi:hypothetical protein
MKKAIVLCLGLLCLLIFLAGQEQYGNIRGKITDRDGVPIPGASIILDCELFGRRSVSSSEAGIFRFLNLSPGIYSFRCELPGFKTHLQKIIDIRVGTNFDFQVILEPAVLEEEMTVIAQTPIVDTKKTGNVTVVTLEALQNIPSARDPWVVLQQVPGILVSDENVGGSGSGMQSISTARGSWGWNNMWNLDGIPITDIAATGSSPMYYDFDTFDQIEIVTGGQDATIQTGAISINFVTRRGGNKVQIMGRTFFTDDSLQGDNRTEELINLGYAGDQIDRIMDYGLQVGGPIRKDRIWFWLGYGVQDIRHLTIAGYPDNTKISSFNTKLNLQLGRSDRAEIAFLSNNKTAEGRGAGPTRPPETTQNQKGIAPYYIKLEGEHIFSPNLILSLKLSYHNTGFELTPQGGIETQVGLDQATGIYSGSTNYIRTERPSYVAMAHANYFMERLLGGSHEFRLGAEFRLAAQDAIQGTAGDTFKYYYNGIPSYASVRREGHWNHVSSRWSFYLNDAFTLGRLTLNLGLRLDREDSWNRDASVSASMTAPDLLPSVNFPGTDPGVIFQTLTPRFGFTYDLTGDGKTILRGNIARYATQQGLWAAAYVSPSTEAWANYAWRDLDGNDSVSTNELIGYPFDGIFRFGGFDPRDSTNFEVLDALDPNLKPELTDEILLGTEREIFTDFSLSATFTFRRNHRIQWETLYDKDSGILISQDDYIGPITGSLTYDGKTYDYEYWTLEEFRPVGYYVFNIPDQYDSYTGFEISAVKRLSRHWMMNASFTYQVTKTFYGEKGFTDPTNIRQRDGERSGVDWMAKLNFLFQLPWGFNFSGFANARQGNIRVDTIQVPTPLRAAVGMGNYLTYYLEKPGDSHLPVFYSADLSLMKDFHLKKAGTLTLMVDTFNIFNFSHPLSRYTRLNSTRYNEIQVILNPRVIRFGVRYSF